MNSANTKPAARPAVSGIIPRTPIVTLKESRTALREAAIPITLLRSSNVIAAIMPPTITRIAATPAAPRSACGTSLAIEANHLTKKPDAATIPAKIAALIQSLVVISPKYLLSASPIFLIILAKCSMIDGT